LGGIRQYALRRAAEAGRGAKQPIKRDRLADEEAHPGNRAQQRNQDNEVAAPPSAQ
jgi:hypothetical protein